MRPTCTIPKSSPLSRASSFLISSSTALAWFFAAEDWSFKFSDIIVAVWCAAVADSCCAVWVAARNVSSSLGRSRISTIQQNHKNGDNTYPCISVTTSLNLAIVPSASATTSSNRFTLTLSSRNSLSRSEISSRSSRST